MRKGVMKAPSDEDLYNVLYSHAVSDITVSGQANVLLAVHAENAIAGTEAQSCVCCLIQ